MLIFVCNFFLLAHFAGWHRSLQANLLMVVTLCWNDPQNESFHVPVLHMGSSQYKGDCWQT